MAASRTTHSVQTTARSPSIELLVVGCSSTLVDMIVVTMRNAGVAIHATQAMGMTDLRQLIRGHQADLVIIGFADTALVKEAVLHILQADADSSIVLLANQVAPDVYALASDLSIRDIVPPEDTARLLMVVLREYQTIQTRRELQLANKLLSEAQALAASLSSQSQNAIACVHDGIHVRANPAYLRLFGIDDAADIEDIPLMDLIAVDDRLVLKEKLRSLGLDTAPQDPQTLETKCLRANGESFSVKLELTAVRVDGELCSQILVRQTSTENAALDAPDPRDKLTGFLTRRSILDHTEAHFSGDLKHGVVGFVMINLIGFSNEKTHLSVSEAENKLRKFALALKTALATKNVRITRYANDQFGVYVPPPEDPNMIAYKAMQAMSRQAEAWQDNGRIADIGIGVATTEDSSVTSAITLIKCARVALHQAEEQGSGIVLFQSTRQIAANTPIPIDSELMELINNALEQDRFRLKFQPIVSLHGDTQEYYAVFIRLLDDRNVELLPAVFLDQAERAGKLGNIDRWVVKHAIHELAQQRRAGRKVVFFISLSHASINDESFLLWVCDCLRESRAKGVWLVFQFKAADLIEFDDNARALTDGLRKINCQVAMDDFADSPESMLLLNRINLDFVKLNRDFMHELAQNLDRQKRLEEINATLKDRRLKTVATTVEDANSLAVLWNVGVNYIQGYFLQKPTSSITYNAHS